MKNSTKTFLFHETYKGFITFLAITLAAALSFHLYEQRLYEQQAKTDALAKERQIKFELANQILEIANDVYMSGILMGIIGERAQYFMKLNPDLESTEQFVELYSGMLEEWDNTRPDKWVPRMTLVTTKSKLILDEDVTNALNDLGDAVLDSFSKMPKILDRASYLRVKLNKQGALAGTDLLKAQSTISALVGAFAIDKNNVSEKYRQLLQLLLDKGYLGESPKTSSITSNFHQAESLSSE